jgi:hypothetical protein
MGLESMGDSSSTQIQPRLLAFYEEFKLQVIDRYGAAVNGAYVTCNARSLVSQLNWSSGFQSLCLVDPPVVNHPSN